MVAAAPAAAITRRQLDVIRIALIAGTFHDGLRDAAWSNATERNAIQQPSQ
jgi:hypothetical protein